MHFNFSFIIPANTPSIAPVTQILPIAYGVITKVDIGIPAGHAATAHLQVLLHEFQIYPLNRDGDYHGDNAVISFNDRQENYEAPYELKARGWNTDPTYSHEFVIGIEIMLPNQLGMQTGTQGLQDLQDLVGTTMET